MNAKKILLTHFSARYPKMPPQFVDLDRTASPTTPTKPLTALFRSSPPSPSSTSPISALPDIPTDSAITPPSAATTVNPEPKLKPREKRQRQAIVGLAFDHMNITLGDFWKLRTYLPAMDQAFGKDEGDEDSDDAVERVMEKMID
jgi:hypothetical protein